MGHDGQPCQSRSHGRLPSMAGLNSPKGRRLGGTERELSLLRPILNKDLIAYLVNCQPLLLLGDSGRYCARISCRAVVREY